MIKLLRNLKFDKTFSTGIKKFSPVSFYDYLVPVLKFCSTIWLEESDTGIASEKEWGIDLNNESINESGVNKDGTSWYRESGQDLGENGYRCRWTVMGGRSADGSTEWKEAV
jgi:hypothetical protein